MFVEHLPHTPTNSLSPLESLNFVSLESPLGRLPQPQIFHRYLVLSILKSLVTLNLILSVIRPFCPPSPVSYLLTLILTPPQTISSHEYSLPTSGLVTTVHFSIFYL